MVAGAFQVVGVVCNGFFGGKPPRRDILIRSRSSVKTMREAQSDISGSGDVKIQENHPGCFMRADQTPYLTNISTTELSVTGFYDTYFTFLITTLRKCAALQITL